MEKFLIKTKRQPSLSPSIEASNFSNSSSSVDKSGGDSSNKMARVEFSNDSIIGDPALRKPIEDYAIGLRDEIRRAYITNGPCQPFAHRFLPSQFGQTSRSFQESWFLKYEWLEYSISKDAAYCFWCFLFKGGKSRHGDDVFTKKGFTNWKKAIDKFNEHIGNVNSPHNDARGKVIAFKNQRQSVSHMISRQSHEMEAAYRTRLTAVVDVIRLLLEQGLAFRGNDESTQSLQRGNFLAILNWYGSRNAEVWKVINDNAPGNNQLTSPLIQKEIVSACAAETTEAIVNELGDDLFALLIDEARDSSVKEQMAVVLRYVNKFGEVVERFLGVVHVSDTSALSLKCAIDDFFSKNGLSLSRLRGQGYDGASNMRGELNGLKTLILNENPHAWYIHCFAHQLQLVIVAVAGGNRHVSEFFEYVSMIVNMVGASCKRKDTLRQKQHDEVVERLQEGVISTGKGKHQETSLARPGDTRWSSHYRTVIRILSMWHSVMEVLQNISDDGVDQKSRGIAGSLVDKMENYEFIFIAHLMKVILGITNELSKLLQQKDQNIGNAIHLIQNVKDQLQELRENGWEEFVEEVNTFCSENDICVPNMEDNVSGRRRSKHGQSITYFHHFRVEIFCQVVDFIIQEMHNRFAESSTELLMCIACLDPKNSFSNFNMSRLLRLAELYSYDFSISDRMELKEQLKNYIFDMRRNDDFSDLQGIEALARKMVETGYHTTFNLVYLLIKLALILPVATATVERAFSAMNIIKTDLRNKMGDDFLTDCLVCYIEKDIFMSIQNEAILQRFQNMNNRRIQLPIVNHP